MNSKDRPILLSSWFFSAVVMVALSLPGSNLAAQPADERDVETTAGSRASVAIGIAAQRLRVSDDELRVVNHVLVGDFTRLKVAHPETGRIEVVDLDAYNREVARERVEQVLATRRSRDFRGKQERELAEKVSGRPADELTTVLIWGRLPGPPPRIERPVPGQGLSVVSERAFRDFHMNATRGVVDHARRQGWIVEYQAQDAPVVVAKVPNGQLQALEARGDVEAVYLGRVYREELNASVPAIDAGTVWARGFTGTGVQVAVVETGGIYFGHSNLADGTYCNTLTDSPIRDHATGVAGIIASTHSTYKGVAYGAPALLSGNAKNATDAEIIKCTEWAVDQGAQVINMSFGTDSTSAMAGLDRYVDYVIRNRFVTIVKSAGNKGFTCTSPDFYVTTPGKGWNVLTVGNYNDGGTASNSNDVMNMDASGGSCYQDPASTHNDREKPEVAAPGTSITTTYCTGPSTCTGTGTGTSFSAPHVAGCAALLIQRSSALGAWPEAIRAILMASAVVNLEGDKRLSEHDGVGGIECDSADDIARGAAGFERHGVYVSTDFPMDITFSTVAGRTVRAVIAWDSTTDQLVGTTAPAADALKADLDLQVLAPDGTYVASSVSWDNSYEIVEFTAPTTGTYTATISSVRFEGDTEFVSFAWWDGTREK